MVSTRWMISGRSFFGSNTLEFMPVICRHSVVKASHLLDRIYALQVSARNSGETKSQYLMFRDGAVATACLPAYIADCCLRGEVPQTGLLTPLDLIDPERLPEITDGALMFQPLAASRLGMG